MSVPRSSASGHGDGPCLGAHIFEKPCAASRWHNAVQIRAGLLRDSQLVLSSLNLLGVGWEMALDAWYPAMKAGRTHMPSPTSRSPATKH